MIGKAMACQRVNGSANTKTAQANCKVGLIYCTNPSVDKRARLAA